MYPFLFSVALVVLLASCGGGGAGGNDGSVARPNDDTLEPAPVPPVASPDTIETHCGSFQGRALAGSVAFQGLPYAKPPEGELRWLPPQPPECAPGVQPAMAFAPACAQLDDAGNVTSAAEDCLYLNVWTPAEVFPAEVRRPVLFFIHGGGNQKGSPDLEQLGVALYDGAALSAQEDVVVITVGYRLGALGFMSHPALAAENPEGLAGNYGLLDQIAALKWVQENIASFGGDPERVVIFGESGGARDVCSLVASPLANGLFSGAIMQSGGCRQRTQQQTESEGRGIAEAAGCDSLSDSGCLRAASVETLLAAQGPEPGGGVFVGQNIGPVVDGYVLLDSPEQVIHDGAHNQVPLIIGANTEETGVSVRGGSAALSESDYQALVRAQFGQVLGNLILARYPVADYATPADAFVAVSTDSQYICPARSVAQSAAAHSPAVYVCRFAKAFESTPLAAGAFHGIELFYVFQKVSELENYPASAADIAIEDEVAGYWSAFASAADPNAGSGGLTHWRAYSATSDNVLMIDASTREVVDPRGQLCDFWQALRPE